MDEWSLQMIESAVQACGKFAFKAGGYSDDVRRDFQLIDWTLLESGLASAGARHLRAARCLADGRDLGKPVRPAEKI